MYEFEPGIEVGKGVPPAFAAEAGIVADCSMGPVAVIVIVIVADVESIVEQ